MNVIYILHKNKFLMIFHHPDDLMIQDPASGNADAFQGNNFSGADSLWWKLHIYYTPETEWMDTKNDRHWKMCRLSNIVILGMTRFRRVCSVRENTMKWHTFFLLVKNVHISLKLVDPSCLNIEGQRIQNKHKISEQSSKPWLVVLFGGWYYPLIWGL